ncbi:MAG: uridine monophosphate kinase [Proteobacteria bacterium]|nr:uridine monophosphate kinase [Pseudomonadota bacterium]
MSLAQATPEPAAALKYKRVLLKISGEALMGDGQYGIDTATCERFAQEVLEARKAGAQICLVIGGGNIFRGMAGAAKGMERASADYMGMLATVMNALAMQNAIESLGGYARVLSAIPMVTVCEPYIRRRAMRQVLARDLKVMDASAIALMRDNAIPIVVFSIHKRGALADVISGRGISTTISD